MTLEELKLEADKLGYKLIKKSERVKFLPCTCGSQKRWMWHMYKENQHWMFYECVRCQKKSPVGRSEKEAKLNWNKMIKEKTHV